MNFLPRNLWVFVCFFSTLALLLIHTHPVFVLAGWWAINACLFLLSEDQRKRLDDWVILHEGGAAEAFLFLLALPLVLTARLVTLNPSPFGELWMRILRGEKAS